MRGQPKRLPPFSRLSSGGIFWSAPSAIISAATAHERTAFYAVHCNDFHRDLCARVCDRRLEKPGAVHLSPADRDARPGRRKTAGWTGHVLVWLDGDSCDCGNRGKQCCG